MNDILPFLFFNPSRRSFAVLSTTVGLCSSIEPPYSLNLNEFESNPYRFNNELNDACVPFDL